MKSIQRFIPSLLLAFLPLLLISSVEIIQRQELSNYLEWIMTHKYEFVLSYLLAFAIINCFFIFKLRYYVSIFLLIFILANLGAYISSVKIKFRGIPFLPFDISLGKEALNVSQYDGFFNPIIILMGISVLIGVFIIIFKGFKAFQYEFKKHVLVASISLILFSILSFEKPIDVKAGFNVNSFTSDPVKNYDQNGFLLGFFLDADSITPTKPDGYSEENMNKILNRSNKIKTEENSVKPNIIYIMSEAFWDPTLMKEVSFSKDPIPFFHYLQENFTSGSMLAPVYGGGTANTEFEALTGLSTKFMPIGAIAYEQYISSPLESMPRILGDTGYNTTAIHTYHNWFYSRDKVYNYLGFDHFISQEFFNDPEYTGPFISDKEISYKILDEIKKNDEPSFIHTVTMQAHGPYPENKNRENTIKVTGSLSEESTRILETYSQSIYDADQALKTLIEGLEKRDEPTIVVFFGDHLPFLGESYQVYKEANFFEGTDDYQDYQKRYRVPFIIWDNFSNQKEELRMTPNFLSPYLLNRIGIDSSPLMNYLNSLYEKGMTVIPKPEYVEHEQVSISEMDNYEMLQYDLLFGERFYYKHNPIKIKEFHFGSDKMHIEEVDILSNGKTIKINMYGENFLANSTVFVNEENVEVQFLNENHIIAIVPKRLLNDDSNIIEVQVLDSLDNPLTKSNKVLFRIDQILHKH